MLIAGKTEESKSDLYQSQDQIFTFCSLESVESSSECFERKVNRTNIGNLHDVAASMQNREVDGINQREVGTRN